MSAPVVRYGLASPGNIGLCRSRSGSRETTIRLVNCPYCQNIVDCLVIAAVSDSPLEELAVWRRRNAAVLNPPETP